MKISTILKNVAYVVVGVFVAGVLMNAMRDTGIVKDAINGFDS